LKTENKIGIIQAFRGIASLLVVFFHARLYINFSNNLNFGTWLFGSGAIGVDIFFIISGFIMVYTTQASDGSSKYTMTFFAKRFFRVWPTYFIITVLYFIFVSKDYSASDFMPHLKDLCKSICFIPIAFNDAVGSAPFYGYATMPQGWTLNYEMYFYLVLGISLFFRKYRWIMFFSTMIMALVLLPLIYGVFSWDAYTDYQLRGIYLNLITNPIIWDFVFGVIIGLLFLSKYFTFKIGSVPLIVLLIAVFLLVLFQYFSGYRGGHGPSRWGGLMAVFILLVVLYIKNVNIKVPHYLSWLGEISYSLYLVHFPVQTILFQVVINSNYPRFASHPLMFFVTITVSLITAAISYKVFEIGLSGWLRNKVVSVFMKK